MPSGSTPNSAAIDSSVSPGWTSYRCWACVDVAAPARMRSAAIEAITARRGAENLGYLTAAATISRKEAVPNGERSAPTHSRADRDSDNGLTKAPPDRILRIAGWRAGYKRW